VAKPLGRPRHRSKDDVYCLNCKCVEISRKKSTNNFSLCLCNKNCKNSFNIISKPLDWNGTTWNAYCSIPYIYIEFIGFEVLTSVIMKNTVFWDMTPCSPVVVHRRFGRTYCMHFQDRILSLEIKQFCFLITSYWLQWKKYVTPEHQRISTSLHGVTYQNTVLFMVTIYYLPFHITFCIFFFTGATTLFGSWLPP
jgi:hypothetical protein